MLLFFPKKTLFVFRNLEEKSYDSDNENSYCFVFLLSKSWNQSVQSTVLPWHGLSHNTAPVEPCLPTIIPSKIEPLIGLIDGCIKIFCAFNVFRENQSCYKEQNIAKIILVHDLKW